MKRQNIAHKDQFAITLGSVPCRQIHPLKNKKKLFRQSIMLILSLTSLLPFKCEVPYFPPHLTRSSLEILRSLPSVSLLPSKTEQN